MKKLDIKKFKPLIAAAFCIVCLAGSVQSYVRNNTMDEVVVFYGDGRAGNGKSGSPGAARDDADLPDISEESPPDGFSEPGEFSGVNINTADRALLETLPGIGPVKAQAIIDYREAYGGFVETGEIMEVRGIGPSTYEKIRDLIRIQ